MNKLYNKIYNAINEGIQKALLIDPNQNDVSINYSYHKIDNVINPYKDHIKKLFNMHKYEDIQNCLNEIIDIYHNTNIQYFVRDFQELLDIYFKLTPIYTYNTNLEWVNFSNVVTIITKNFEEKPLLLKQMSNISFIKFKNTNFGSDIIFHIDLLVADDMQWNNQQISENKFNNIQCIVNTDENTDYNGYEHTYNNINIENNDYSNYPALQYCINQSIDDYQGYLPAVGEIKFLFKIKRFLWFILSNIQGEYSIHTKYSNILQEEHFFWTSTEYNYQYAFGISEKMYNKYRVPVCENSPCISDKNRKHYILPFFKKV